MSSAACKSVDINEQCLSLTKNLMSTMRLCVYKTSVHSRCGRNFLLVARVTYLRLLPDSVLAKTSGGHVRSVSPVTSFSPSASTLLEHTLLVGPLEHSHTYTSSTPSAQEQCAAHSPPTTQAAAATANQLSKASPAYALSRPPSLRSAGPLMTLVSRPLMAAVLLVRSVLRLSLPLRFTARTASPTSATILLAGSRVLLVPRLAQAI